MESTAPSERRCGASERKRRRDTSPKMNSLVRCPETRGIPLSLANASTGVPVDTKCIFGISKRPTDLPPYTQQMVHQGGRSYLIVHAPGNRTYWFLFKGTGKTIYGKDIPRYSEDDKEKLASEHKDDKVYDDLTFGAIYKNRIMSTLVPLEEYVFEKWHYKRIITIGDASHKVGGIQTPMYSRPRLTSSRSTPSLVKVVTAPSKLQPSSSTP